jgi:FMN phosphatase YigB (HAD superfamily)
MNKSKIILTDADGTIVNWNQAFEKFMESQGLPRIPGTEDEYSISVRHNIPAQTAMSYVQQFNESSAIANLEPFADSVEYVGRLAELGFRFIVVTCISDHPSAQYHRTQNLHSLFGDVFDEIHCIPLGASKANILLNWADTGFFWIEDHMRQAEAGYEAGLNTVLIDHPYNSHYNTDLFPRVSHTSPWREVYDMVCKEYRIDA